jgi:8-oxo-dGTP pyrophosphatase MutT (NUDIX family)
LKEETGLETEEKYLIELPKKYTADIERKVGKIVRFYHTVFVCTKFSGELKSAEDVEPEWVEIDKLQTFNLLPNVENMIHQALNFP